jgi:hypothetical protein
MSLLAGVIYEVRDCLEVNLSVEIDEGWVWWTPIFAVGVRKICPSTSYRYDPESKEL